MSVCVSYQKDSGQAISPTCVEDTIRRLVAMLQSGQADAYFVASALARYAADVPDVMPLVQFLADQLDDDKRTKVLSNTNEKQTDQPSTVACVESHDGTRWDHAYATRVKGLAGPQDDPASALLEIRIDPELARIALGLDQTALYRVWIVLRHEFGHPGWTTRQSLSEALLHAGIDHSRRHLNRLLKRGSGRFWGLSDDGRVWLRGYKRVAMTLTSEAMQSNPDLVLTNYPGVRDVYVRVDGPIKTFRARLYAGWLAHRENPKIARATLCKLFAVTKETLWAWEAAIPHTVRVVHSYTQLAIDPKQDDRVVDFIPDHAISYLTTGNKVRLRWQSPNVYHARLVRQHPHKGQSRKVRAASARIVDAFLSAENRAGQAEQDLAFGRTHWQPRQYYATADALRRHIKRQTAMGDESSADTPRHVFRGLDRRESAIYEMTFDGDVKTHAWERISIKKEFVWRYAEKDQRQGRGVKMAG